jgi:hypothetical protein
VAAAYLAYPALQWASIWHFHPETLAAGFLGLAALVLIPMANGRPSPHLELNYGITGSGPSAILAAAPTLAGNVWRSITDGKGASYLLLILTPFLGLPLVDPRWLLPVARRSC